MCIGMNVVPMHKSYSNGLCTLLHSIELQLVLQLLDNKSRLAAGATCQRIMHEVLQAHSWKYGELVHMDSPTIVKLQNQKPAALTTTPAPYSLLRLAPVQLVFPFYHSEQLVLSNEAIAEHVSHIFSLKYDAHKLSTFLNHPKMQMLRQFNSAQSLSCAATDDAIVALPHIRSLGIWPSNSSDVVVQHLLTRLLSCGQLIELALFGGESQSVHSLLQNIPHNLRRLHICWSSSTTELDVCFSSSALQELRVVSLALSGAMSKDEIRGALAAMKFVHTLRLSIVGYTDLNSVLSQLVAAPSLVRVYLDCTSLQAKGALVPLQSSLHNLLVAAP